MSVINSPKLLKSRSNPYFIGHDAAENSFLDTWMSGRIAHAWLICGQRGIGKSLLAYRMARFAMLQGPNTGSENIFSEISTRKSLQMSGEHDIFRRISALGHSDFRVVERGWADAKQNKRKTVIGIDDVRNIGGFFSKTSAEHGWRVVVIDAVDEMNVNAANAVLKILEEPPRRSLLLLVAHNPDRLLLTIRSRCRRLDLQPLVEHHVVALLNRYRPDLDEGDVHALAILGEGSIGRALELADEGGVSLFRDLMSLLSDAPKLNISSAQALADKAARGDGFRTISGLISWWLARIATNSVRDKLPALPEVVAGEQSLALKLMSSSTPEMWGGVWLEMQLIIERTQTLHLDRKRSLLLILNSIMQTAEGRRAA